MKKIIFLLLAVLFFQIAVPNIVSANTLYITSTPSFYGIVSKLYTYKVSAKDAAGYSINFTEPSKPSWLSFQTKTNTLEGTPTTSGKFTVTLDANDNHGNTDTQSYFLYISAPASTPTPVKPTPTAQPKPTATITNKPTATVKPTETAKPTQIVTNTPIQSTISITKLSPADKSITTDTSPTVSGSILTYFPLDKSNFAITFDNTDITTRVNLTTQKATNNQYTNTFNFKTTNLTYGTHYLGINIQTPAGIPVPTDVSFQVKAQTSGSGTTITQTGLAKLIPAAIALLLFIIILATLIRRSRKVEQAQ